METVKRILALCLICSTAFAVNPLVLRVQKYVFDNRGQIPDMEHDVRVSWNKGNPKIVYWRYTDLLQPTEDMLPTIEEARLLTLPRNHIKKVAGKWVEKTDKEKTAVKKAVQLAKPLRLRKAEHKLIKGFRSFNIMTTNDVTITESHYDEFYEKLQDLNDNQSDNLLKKFDKQMRLIKRFGGREDDVYWHPELEE